MAAIDWKTLRHTLIGARVASVIPPDIKLPMLPTAVMEFSKQADDPNSSAGSLAKIIESDSGLTGELLRYVNSSSVGLRTKAATTQSAITMLGIRNSKLFLLTAGVNNAMKACQSKLVNFQNFWTTNLERALFAREVASILKADGDLAFACSMLHDFLLPVLTNELLPQYLAFTELPARERTSLIDYERKTLGWDHALATAEVMLNWRFPDDLICGVLLHHSGLKLLADPELGRTHAAAVAIAALVPDPLRQEPYGLEQLVKLAEKWKPFDLAGMADRTATALAGMAPKLGNHISLQHRVQKAMPPKADAGPPTKLTLTPALATRG